MRRAALLVASWMPLAALAQLDLESMTWTELRDAINSGRTTVIVPVGGTEQNGPHMALGKHNVRALALARRIAKELGDALVAPVIAYVPEGSVNPPAAHMKFPGTISVPEDAFEKTIESTARSLLHAGFRHVVFLGDHGGYAKNLARVAAHVNAGGAAAVIVPREYYQEMDHAGRDDTSLSLAIDPALVRAERIAAPVAGDGVRGDARGASAQRGAQLADAIVERTTAAIRKARGDGPVK